MRGKYKYILLTFAIAILLIPQCAIAQSDAQFSQYFEVPSYYNAGAIGRSDFVHIRGGSRMQWVGIPKAPKTFIATADMPLKLLDKRFGVGLIMQQESMGLYKNMLLGAQLGYQIKLFGGTLSAGVQIGFVDESFKGSEIYLPDDDDYHEGNDDAIPTTDIRGNAFDLGLGAFYTHKYFWAGASVTHLTSPTIAMNAESGEGGEEKNYEFQIGRVLYFMTGSNIPLKNTLFELQPSLMVKTDFSVFSAEITARARYNKFLSFGVGYRWKEAVMIMAGAEYKNFFVGYAYDYPLSAIARASSGSHELLVGYKMKIDLSGKNKNKHRSIRIM